MDLQLEPKPKGAAKGSRIDSRPTYDQIYLADRINEDAPQGRLTLPAMQKLNSRYGVAAVEGAMRLLRGFPPAELTSPYAYVVAILKEQSNG